MFPQSAAVVKPRTAENMADRIARKYAMYPIEPASTPQGAAPAPLVLQPENPSSPYLRSASSITLATNWTKFTGSMNIYGTLLSTAKPLQYNDDVNAITFVHRKSATYQPNPTPATNGAATGALVTMVSANMGISWDSTCVWNDDNNWARHPQGGILNPAGNTSLANATMVVTAPVTQAISALGWIGSGYGAKKLGNGTYNTTAGSQTFVPNSSPFGSLGSKVDFPSTDFTTTDNGYVYSLGLIFDGSANGTSAATQGYRGARLIRGEFISGSVLFTHDSIIPDVRVSNVTGPLLSAAPGMAWSENGQIGYIYHFGSVGSSVPSHSSGVNCGFQPIVWKTTDFGGSWAAIQPIDFTLPAFQSAVIDHVPGTSSNPNVTIPSFNTNEGVSAVVDVKGNLHLAALIDASFSPDPDSTAFTTRFPNYDGESYHFLHLPGARPYLYDFTTNGAGWDVTVIDSLSSESPGTTVSANGYAANPWDATGGSSGTDKVAVDARIQLSRTPDGKNIVYTWAENDSNITVVGGMYQKWNKFPNVKARLMRVETSGTPTLSATELIVTRAMGSNNQPNPNVSNRGYNHFASPRCAQNTTAGIGSHQVAIHLPITVSNSPAQLEQLNPVNHWYSTAPLIFDLDLPTGIEDRSTVSMNSSIYPNPAKHAAVLQVDLKTPAHVAISIINLIGQTVKTAELKGETGANAFPVDLEGLPKGVYLVNVKAGDQSSSKKLVIE